MSSMQRTYRSCGQSQERARANRASSNTINFMIKYLSIVIVTSTYTPNPTGQTQNYPKESGGVCAVGLRIDYKMRRSENPSDLQMSLFTFTHDHYLLQLPPHHHTAFYSTFPLYLRPDFKGQPLQHAPVLRLYGTNKQSRKCCCHVHGYFPSLYIKAGPFAQTFADPPQLLAFLLSLETAFAKAHRSEHKQLLFRAELQQKYDFYGYHTRKQPFLRLELINPQDVGKLRELLSSPIVGGRPFQCYEAHLNYHMQFFADLNVYGSNEMRICGYTLRQHPLQTLFQKLPLKPRPEMQPPTQDCYNSLHKTSSCEVEIDLDYRSILNAYQTADSSQEEISSSDEEILAGTLEKRKLKVTVTKALQQIWRDEKKRRSRFKITRPLEAVIDLSKNVESTAAVQEGLRDPLWVNFLTKGDNAGQFIRMVRSYESAGEGQRMGDVRVDVAGCQEYREEVERRKQQLVEKVHGRWKYYAQRKDRIIGELMSGERGELPEWEEDASASDSEDSGESLGSEVSEVDTVGLKKEKEVGNTVKYRNNFKFEMGGFKSGSVFSECRFCRSRIYHCQCQLCPHCKNEHCTCPPPPQLTPLPWREVQLQWGLSPPSQQEVAASSRQQYQKPFYSKLQDLFQHYKLPNSLPMQLKVGQYLQKELRNTTFFNRQPPSIKNQLKLPYFYTLHHSSRPAPPTPTTYELQYQPPPPTRAQSLQFLNKKGEKPTIRPSSTANVEDTFVADILVFSYELLLEVTPPLYCGDPQKHPIFAVIFEIYNEQTPADIVRGVIVREREVESVGTWEGFGQIWVVPDQRSILSLLINLVFRVDADILLTWDMQRRGIRYLAERGILHGINMANCLSRACDMEELFEHVNFIDYKVLRQTHLPVQSLQAGNIQELARRQPSPSHDYYLSILQEKLRQRLAKRPVLRKNYYFDLTVKGRLNLNLSRTCEGELKLRSYSLPSVVQHLFSTQLPELTDTALWTAWNSQALATASKRLEYVRLVVRQLNVVGGVIEKSKIFGADFPSMMERGSQFKIESVLCRTTKQNDYLTLSATKEQVANQAILECRPFVMEPPKEFYPDPVLLFDFQSLYPSVMIAYNLCYSTCLGNLNELFRPGRVKRLGVTAEAGLHLEQLVELLDLEGDEEALGKALSHYIFVSPNRVAFVRKNLREGFIPRILLEFLLSRIMIKDSSKLYHRESVKKALGERQLALKMFMNVMFGYTGASFTGRMPCSEIADAVVEVSKYCLRQAIDHLNSHGKYKGHVLYGDTDSIFYHVPGLPLGTAFTAGVELAAEITKLFPYPMEMKFEKVYESLFLVSKKRYYGKSYESAQSPPKYEGKGLQTVRRDGIPFTSDTMDKLLRVAIDSKDLSAVKELLMSESRRLLQGEVAAYSLSLAKEVKLLKYSSKTMPAHGHAARRLESIDRMLAPRYGERCKYVIVHGGETVRGRAIPLFEYMLHPDKYKLDLKYYYEKQFLPPLRRVLISLANIDEWGLQHQYSRDRSKPSHPAHCTHPPKKGQLICPLCLSEELHLFQSAKEASERICRQCTGSPFETCVQWDCRNIYARKRAKEEYQYARGRAKELEAIKELMGC